MLLDYNAIKNIVPFERLANRCDAVNDLWQRTNYNYEYGISWSQFLEDHREEAEPLIIDWLETVTGEEILEMVILRQSEVSRELDRINELLFRYREG